MSDRESLLSAPTLALDPDLIRAIAWCRILAPKERPHDDASYRRAEELGLLAHDPIWRATPQGEGVLIAIGMLEPTWVKERTKLIVLWAREPREYAAAQFVKAWAESYEDVCHEAFTAEKKQAEADWHEWPGEGSQWLFWTTHEEMGRP